MDLRDAWHRLTTRVPLVALHVAPVPRRAGRCHHAVTEPCCALSVNRAALACLVFATACSSPAARTPAPPHHTELAQRIVIVSIDGMMPDVYLDPDAHGL